MSLTKEQIERLQRQLSVSDGEHCIVRSDDLREALRSAEPAQPVAEAVKRIIERSSHCMVTDGTGAVHSAVKAKISDLEALCAPPMSDEEILRRAKDSNLFHTCGHPEEIIRFVRRLRDER